MATYNIVENPPSQSDIWNSFGNYNDESVSQNIKIFSMKIPKMKNENLRLQHL